MDAIRKKMQSLKGETDVLYATIARFEGITKDANSQSDTHEADIRDLGKKISGYESDFDETNDKFIKAMTALEEKEKSFKTAEEEVRQFFKLKVHVYLLKSLNHKIDAF
jgi:chromosome segregation ATPase